MPVWPGRFKGKHPIISLLVSGTRGNPEQFDVVIDTGFDGFLMMSRTCADRHQFQHGPATMGTMADGSRVALPTALANVGFAGRSHQGMVTLVENDVIQLAGIDFLRAFKLALVMTNEQIWLMDEPDFERIAVNSGARLIKAETRDSPLPQAKRTESK